MTLMRRRDIIKLLGGAAVAWPLTARAQHSARPVVGFLHAGSPEPNVKFVEAFREGLSDAGYIEGQNVGIEFRWAKGQLNRLPELADDLVQRRVAVIATPLSTQATVAAKAATSTIPIVFGSGGDPVALRLVESFNRPGGNATGIAFMTGEIGGKRLSILHELIPAAVHFAVLGNSHNLLSQETIKELQATAQGFGQHIDVVYAGTSDEMEAAFVNLARQGGDGLLIAPDEFFTSQMAQLAALSLNHKVPSAYVIREFTALGGLMSYGPSFASAYRAVGNYTARVLKGEKPSEMPVSQPTKFEMVINLKTAKALNLAVPDKMLALADEVIE
jgi:putative tryptophan/tyrosine transport system substrate-binding protein